MSRSFWSIVCLTVCACLVAATVGCGGKKTVEVTGKITFEGQPLPGVQVSFDPKDSSGSPALGYTDAQGNYKLLVPGGGSAVPVGEYVVRIEPAETDDPQAVPIQIPPCYNEQSKLTVKVEPGKTSYDFNLTRDCQ